MSKKYTTKSYRWLFWIVIFSSALIIQTSSVQAETMDYDLNQASRLVKAVDGDLKRLREGDVAAYNRTSKKMEKAAKHLEATQSKSHAEYAPTIKHWGELQAQMADIATKWNTAVAQQQAQVAAQQQAAEAEQQRQQAQATAIAEQKAAATAQQKAKKVEQQRQQDQAAAAKPQVEMVDLDPLMEKYQRQNLPKLNDDATASQAKVWAQQMLALQTTHMQADLKTIDEALQTGAASKNDADRVRYWISDSFQGTIKREVQDQMAKQRGMVKGIKHSVDLIHSIEDGDANGAYRVAGPIHGPNNKLLLENAIRSGEVVANYAEVYGEQSNTENAEIAALVTQIKSARNRIDELEPLAKKQEKAFANAPKKEHSKNKEFLPALAQKFWLNGSVIAETEKDGSVWIDSNDVGDITHNGEIWIDANHRGSIEPNGDVWFDGNQVGNLEENGKVWRDSNQVGLIDKEGTVWVNGNPAGEIEPFNGEWKRAAILYYFSDFYQR